MNLDDLKDDIAELEEDVGEDYVWLTSLNFLLFLIDAAEYEKAEVFQMTLRTMFPDHQKINVL